MELQYGHKGLKVFRIAYESAEARVWLAYACDCGYLSLVIAFPE